MSVSAGADYSYSVLAGTSVVDKRAATIHGKGATVVVANYESTSDTKTEDTVNLKADFSQGDGTTATSKLTSALAKALQASTHVDAQTGAREINQGAADTLVSEVGKLLSGSGFSKSDAAAASASLVKQFSSQSGSNVVALSLTGQSQNAGSYTASVGGGTEASAYNVQSTSTLNLNFNTSTGDLSLKLDQHKIAATRIEWSSATASDVSISLSEPELDAIGFTPVGTAQNNTGSAVQETQTVTSSSTGGLGSSNVVGPDALSRYRDFENGVSSPSLATSAGSSSSAGNPSSSASASKTQSSAELALIALKKIVAQARASNSQQNQTVGISITQKLGTAVSDAKGDKFLLFNRPNGDTGSIGVAGVSVQA